MKFSIAAISALILSSAISFTTADSYSDAIKAWCGGLKVTAPTASTVVVAGQKTKITVTRKASDKHTKTITGLDLYSVSSTGKASYVQNVWKGSYALKKSASITDTVPKNIPAGLYYYRVWITNMIDGQHGPDCLETSHTFKVTTSSHTNAAGETEYAEYLHDDSIYPENHYNGCFGLNVDYPSAGSTFNTNEHVLIQLNRDSASQTGEVTKVELYKGDKLVNTVWQGSELFQSSFNLKDHLALNNVDPNAEYHYKIYTTSTTGDNTCTFKSNSFKIQQS